MAGRAKPQNGKMPQSKTQGLPKRDRSSTEEKLLFAGTAIFSKYGYDAATTKLISTKSGVNESLIMRYFGGKEGLLLEILRRYFEENRKIPLNYPPQDNLKDELTHYIKFGRETSKKNKEIVRIMLLRASLDTKIRDKVQAMLPAEGDPKFIERFNMLKAKKKVPQDLDHKLISLIGFQNFSTTFISGFLFDEKTHKEIQTVLDKLVEYTIDGILK
jgi:AcrR family transcriptional regulator